MVQEGAGRSCTLGRQGFSNPALDTRAPCLIGWNPCCMKFCNSGTHSAYIFLFYSSYQRRLCQAPQWLPRLSARQCTSGQICSEMRDDFLTMASQRVSGKLELRLFDIPALMGESLSLYSFLNSALDMFTRYSCHWCKNRSSKICLATGDQFRQQTAVQCNYMMHPEPRAQNPCYD